MSNNFLVADVLSISGVCGGHESLASCNLPACVQKAVC